MKQGKPVINIVMMALAAALAVYFGVYLFRSLHTPYTTARVYQYTLLDSSRAEALLVREEQVLPGQSGIVDVTRSEGERVGAGQTVATVYRDTRAQDNQAQLDSLRLEAALLNYAMTRSGDLESAARLDEDIVQSLVYLRDAAAHNNYTRLEELVVEVKSGVLKRGYTYGDGVTSDELNARRLQLKAEIDALKQETAGEISRVTVAQSGTFSNLVDGMETLVTPQTVGQLDPAQLHSLMDEKTKGDPEAVGKLITSERWYLAAAVPASTAKRLRAGESTTVRFAGDFNQDVPMQVEQVGAVQGKEAVVVLSSNRYLSNTAMLRRQTVEIIFDSSTGLRLPKRALRMIKDTSTDPETGAESQKNRLGVYVLVAGRTEFKEVEVVAEGGDYYVVRPLEEGRKLLRSGDQVIVKATGLYAGQLLG